MGSEMCIRDSYITAGIEDAAQVGDALYIYSDNGAPIGKLIEEK